MVIISSAELRNNMKNYLDIAKNKHTTWYVFYSIHEQDGQTVFLVRYLGNNHIIAHHLVEELD